MSAFLRTGLAPEDRNPVHRYFDTGLDFPGLIPGREKDTCGIAFSFADLSPGLRQPGRGAALAP